VVLWLSLARIYPSRHRARRLSIALAGFYIFLAAFANLLSMHACRDSAWGTRQRIDRCYTGEVGKRTPFQDVSLAIAVSEYFSTCR